MPDLRPILLVEDSPKDLELTLAALEKCQLANEIAIARDGAEALDYLYGRGKFSDRAEGDPAVVLLDLKLPKIDGLEVLRRLKADPAMKTIPTVVLTSSREQRDVLESYQLGVNSYIVKPVNFDHYSEVVRDLGIYWLVLNQPPKVEE